MTRGRHFRLLSRVGLRAGLVGRFCQPHTHKWYLIDQHTDLHVSTNLAVANPGIQTLGVAKCLINYAGQPAQDDLLTTHLPDKGET